MSNSAIDQKTKGTPAEALAHWIPDSVLSKVKVGRANAFALEGHVFVIVIHVLVNVTIGTASRL